MRTELRAAICFFAIGVPAIPSPVATAQVVKAGDPPRTRLVASSAEGAALAQAGTRRTSLLAAIDAPTTQLQSQQAGREVTIDELQRIALARNVDLLAVRQEIAAARGLLTQTRLRPNPGLDVTIGTSRPLGSAGERDIEIGYAQTFELGGKRARRIDVGRVGVQIAELLVADRERLLIAAVKMRYAEALAARRNLEMLGELSELTDRAYRVAQQRVSEGEAAPVERTLLQVEAGRLTADHLLAASAGARAVAELKLAAGLDPTELLPLRGELNAPTVALPLEEAIANALAARPDLGAARAEEERTDAELRLARAERVPDVIGVARYGRVESQFPQFGTTSSGQLAPLRDRDHMLTLGVSIPLPFANRNQGNIETSMARRQAAALRRQFVEESVRTEVTAAYLHYVAALRALEAFGQDVVNQAQESITIIRTSYDLGEVQLLDLLQEQRRLVETQKAYTEILKEHYVARAALEAAMSAEVK
jgi:cobalt-zinc-cadmium efflux system outer membrane protein